MGLTAKNPPAIKHLRVSQSEDYMVGADNVIGIRFSKMDGPMGRYAVVQVFKGQDRDFPYAEFPFHNCISVCYGELLETF